MMLERTNEITDEMLDAFLGEASNKQARINLRHECSQDEEVYEDVLDYWYMLEDLELNIKWQRIRDAKTP
tara:strand:+ start:361 stop:570 length:210 start_codon:yes stop_codon:yes gene_type:complete